MEQDFPQTEEKNEDYRKVSFPALLPESVCAEDHARMWNLLDLLFPRRSLIGEEGGWITDAELRQLQSQPVILDIAALRAQGLHSIDRIVAAAEYDSVPLLHRAVHLLKYKKVRGIGESLGKMLVDVSVLCLPSPAPHQSTSTSSVSGAGHPLPQIPRCARNAGEGPVLCPVPLHWIRKFSRGFNQAEFLAYEVGQRRGWAVQHLLRRTRWTGSQVGRHRKDRLIGVQDAFEVNRGLGLGLGLGLGMEIPQCVVLVDDLSTTGATLDACAKVLKNAGVKTVEGLVIAVG